jgi:plastocyanin
MSATDARHGWALRGAASAALLAGEIASVVLLSACGSKSAAPPPGPTTPPLTTTTPNPAATLRTVDVIEYDIGFKLSKHTVPTGRITFNMQNSGAITHNFDIVNHKAGPYLDAGGVATMVVNLKPGSYYYQCDVKEHAQAGMKGTLIVTPVKGASRQIPNPEG